MTRRLENITHSRIIHPKNNHSTAKRLSIIGKIKQKTISLNKEITKDSKTMSTK